MFDHIGTNPDDDATKRSLQSMLITVGMFSAITGSVLYTGYRNREAILEQIEDFDMVELIMEEVSDDLAPPPPPPPPPASSAAEEEPETPDELNEEIKELTDEVKEEVVTQEPVAAAGGVEGGVEGGVVGGVVGGVLGGTGTGARVFHHSELEVKRRLQPKYPEAAREMNLGEQRCKARVFIDERGIPYDVIVEGCPQAFHSTTKQALLQWRWYPPKDGRDKVKAQTIIAVTYKLK